MSHESIRVSAVFPTTAEDIYRAWLDGQRHGDFTGGTASVEPRVGGRHTAWDGYIEGQILELEPGRRIVQSWRSLDFPIDAQPSRLEVLLSDAPDGHTEVTLIHTDIPEGQGADYEEGWVEHYFKPMQRYFTDEASEPAPPRAPAAPATPRRKAVATKKAAPKKPAALPKKKKIAPKKRAAATRKAVPKKKATVPKKKKTKGKKR